MKITELEIDAVHAYDNEEYEGLRIEWSSNIGWGQCDIYRAKENDQWMADTEHMCTNEDRTFLKKLLEKLADTVEVTS